MSPPVGVGAHSSIRVPRRRVAPETSPTLPVLDQHDLPGKPVRVVQHPLDQAAHHVAVGAAAVLPLHVHLDQHDIIGGDESLASAHGAPAPRAVELHPLSSHQIHQALDAGVAVRAQSTAPERLVGNVGNPEEAAETWAAGLCNPRQRTEAGEEDPARRCLEDLPPRGRRGLTRHACRGLVPGSSQPPPRVEWTLPLSHDRRLSNCRQPQPSNPSPGQQE